MINIVNLNPSIDYFVIVKDLKLNKTNHSESESVCVGGKGSNIGMLLDNLKIPSTIFGFRGGFTGDYIASELSKYKYISDKMIDTKQLTRINIKLTNQNETEINGSGPTIKTKYIKQLEASLSTLKKGDLLVMTGRIAKGMSVSWYLEMVKIISQKKIDFVLDVNDEVVKSVLPYKPFLLKPNEDEIKTIFKHQKSLSKKDLYKYGTYMINQGAKYLIISLASQGSLFFFKDKIYKSENLKRKVISSVGSGDSMIAGFLAEYQISKDPLKAYKFAQACGNATAFSKGMPDIDMIKSVYKEIEIIEVDYAN